MNLAKVKEALADLQRQRELIDEAIKGLRNVVAAMGDSNGQKKLFFPNADAPLGAGSYVDLAVNLITSNGGKPLHVNTILEHIRKVKGNPEIKRQSVEATFFRHMTDKKEYARLVKSAPGMYGIKRFPREEQGGITAVQKN